MIRAGIIGGAGYTGGELIRLLVNHPEVEIAFVNSKSNAGNYLHKVHGDLAGETDLLFSDELNDDIDVLFLCVGHGEARSFLDVNGPSLPEIKIIDLSQDYRLNKNNQVVFHDKPFTYGLPELNKEEIRKSDHVANPGCFATAIQLGLLPLAKERILKEVHTTGITGSTGAGQSLQSTSHFSWRANNVQAYKTLQHQHIQEVLQSLSQLQPGFSLEENNKTGRVNFIPWRGDFTRGIYVSSCTDTDISYEKALELYKSYYQEHPFTIVSETMIDLKQAVNTNKCMIHLEKVNGKLVIHTAIDNLLKGASGQAVQNMNLMFGIEETMGLKLKANYF
jgi:N-acetyl-gamma-glutamyl-phosphate reductase